MAGNPFYEGIEDVREATQAARAKDAAVAEIRRELADVHRQAARVQRNYQAARERNDPAWDRVLKACELLLQLRDLEAELDRLGPVASLPYTAAKRLIPQLAGQAHQLLLRDETAVKVAGAYASNCYQMAALILKMAGSLPASAQPSKRTSARPGKRSVASATGEDRSWVDASFRDSIRKTKAEPRTKEVKGTVRAAPLKTKGGKPTAILNASSDSVDVENDRFTVSALQDMARDMKGHACFISHKYDPLDVFGMMTDAQVTKVGDKHLLRLTVEVATENPKAATVYSLIKSGVKLGASVGVLVLRAAPDKDNPKITNIDHVRGLETSIVGLPANWEDGWVQSAS